MEPATAAALLGVPQPEALAQQSWQGAAEARGGEAAAFQVVELAEEEEPSMVVQQYPVPRAPSGASTDNAHMHDSSSSSSGCSGSNGGGNTSSADAPAQGKRQQEEQPQEQQEPSSTSNSTLGAVAHEQLPAGGMS